MIKVMTHLVHFEPHPQPLSLQWIKNILLRFVKVFYNLGK